MPDAQSDLRAVSGHEMRRNSKNGVTRQRSYFALEQVAMKRSYQFIPYPLLSGEVVYILLYLGSLGITRG